jgi:hypothetical protein
MRVYSGRRVIWGDLKVRVAPLQSTDTMIAPAIAVILIGAIAVEADSGNPPQADEIYRRWSLQGHSAFSIDHASSASKDCTASGLDLGALSEEPSSTETRATR